MTVRHYVPSNLFSFDTNPKTVKGQKYGFMTAVLYMAPATKATSGKPTMTGSTVQ